MRILKNVTQDELKRYASQPTAKALHERMMKDSVYVPKGDVGAAAVFVASRESEKAANLTDTVEISGTGREMSKVMRDSEKAENISFNIRRRSDGSLSLSFDSAAMVSRAVKQGYLEIDGKKLALTDDVKKQLMAASKQIQDTKKSIAMHNMLLHETANARQTSDAMKEANDKMSRAMTTAARIMHGRKVSPSDEKELMEFNKDLYAMAKSAAALAEHRRKREDKEDEKISAENEEARTREAEPKDYSVEETPLPQTEVQMDVSFEEDIPQVKAVGVGLPE